MPSDKSKELPNNNENDPDFDRTEALKQALLKLKAEGKITELPSDIFGTAAAQNPVDVSIPPQSTTDEIAADMPATMPDKVIDTEAEKARWSAVLSGWDTTPQRLEKEARKRKTSEIEVVVNPEQDAKMAQVAAEAAAESESWGQWDVPAEANDEANVTILEDWNAPQVLEAADDLKALVIRKQITPDADIDKPNAPALQDTPWTLQQFFNGEIDLDVELQKRFPAVPIVSAVKFRTLGSEAQRRVATLTATDGTASVIIDADVKSKQIQISFTYGSMLTLRYSLADLSDADRSRWLELMRREKGGLAFLWGPTRWQKDYLICISRQYATKIYAFSPNHFESAVRLSQDVMDEIVKWLDEIWRFQPKEDNDDAPLLTW
jgi:hypothetical protein